MIRYLLTILVAILFSGQTEGQVNKKNQNTFLEAEYFFMNEDYQDALNYYLQLYQDRNENANLAFRIGVCYLNISGKKDLAVKYLEKAASNMSAKRKEGTLKETTAPYNALYELARAYRINYNCDRAKEYFTRYKEILSPDDKENREFIDHEIDICDMAKILIGKPRPFTLENAGETINDEKSNYNPVITADGKTLFYMTTLKFYDAIMVSVLKDNKWSAPVNIFPDLQLDGDVSISAVSGNGKMIYLTKDDNSNSDIYTSVNTGSGWSAATMLNKNINTKYWESHATVSDDGKQLIFASDRPGGFGGLDLYISVNVNGDWGPAVNLGPAINTKFNEDMPFITNGGKVFFCSQGHENIGGYDLFSAERLADGSWGKPVNAGYPLNTPDDNTYFMPLDNGSSGYVFEDKGSEGFGRNDIFKLIFK